MPDVLQSIFTVAHTDISSAPLANSGRTMRVVIPMNVTATGFTVQFSNRCGRGPLAVAAASLAAADEQGNLLPETQRPLTVGGAAAFILQPGEEAATDPVQLAVSFGSHIAVSVYYPEGSDPHSGNWLGNTAFRSRHGNYCASLTMPGPHFASRFSRTVLGVDLAVQLVGISRVVAHCPAPAATVGVFGDSITQQCTWTTPLTKLLYTAYPGAVSLCNLGIAGNRLLADSADKNGVAGPAGTKRFFGDLASLPGLTHAVLALGANDIGQPGTHGVPDNAVPTLDAYATALTGMADTLRAQGVRVYAATITPRLIQNQFTEAREAVRLGFNAWIRTAPCFDAVLDFDAVLRREDGAPGMRDRFAQPDGLHPTPLGGLFMAKAVDINLFQPEGVPHA